MRMAIAGWLGLALVAVALADPPADFRRERDEAVKAGAERIMPGFPLSAADAWAARADAIAASHPADAARLYREARWRLPAVPLGAPTNLGLLLGDPRVRHASGIRSLAYNTDATRLVTASLDGSARVWDLANGRLIAQYRGHSAEVRAAVWMPKTGMIASAGGKEVHVWDPTTEKPIATMKGATEPLNAIAVTLDGATLFGSGADRVVRAWNVADGKELTPLGGQNATVNALDLSRDGRLLAAVNGDGGLSVWDISDPDRKRILESRPFPGAAFAVRFSPDGKSLAVSGDAAIKLIDIKMGSGVNSAAEKTPDPFLIKRTLEGANGHADIVTALAFSPDGKRLATGGGTKDRSVRLWNLSTAQVFRTLFGHTGEVSTLAFSPDGQELASAGQDQIVRFWDLAPVPPAASVAKAPSAVWAVAISPDGRQIATAGADQTIRIAEASTGKVLKTLKGHTRPVSAIAFAADGRSLYSTAGDKTAKVWNLADGTASKTMEGHESVVLALAAKSDGTLLVTGGGDRTVRGWEPTSGRLAFTWPGHRAAVTAVAIRLDGGQIASAGADGFIKTWNVATGKEEATFKAHESGGTAAIAYFPEGRRLVSVGGDKLVKIWNLGAGQPKEPLVTFAGHSGPVTAVALTSDGKLLATAGADATVKVWDVATTTEIQAFRWHTEWIAALAFSTDGSTVVSGGVDGETLVWKLSGSASESLPGHRRAVTALAVHPKIGLVSGGEDRNIIIWNPTTGQPQRNVGGSSAALLSLAVSDDGSILVGSAEDRRLRIWDIATGQALRTIDSQLRIPAVVFEPGGRQFVAWQLREGSDEDVTSIVVRYDAEGRDEELIAEKGKSVRCLALSADAKHAIVGAPDGAIRVWDLTTRQKLGDDVKAHTGPIADVAIASDGTMLSANAAGEIKVWKLTAKPGDALATVKSDVKSLVALAVNPKGTRFAALGTAGDLQVFDKTTAKPLAQWSLGPRVGAISFTADGNRLAVANGDGTIYLLDLPQ